VSIYENDPSGSGQEYLFCGEMQIYGSPIHQTCDAKQLTESRLMTTGRDSLIQAPEQEARGVLDGYSANRNFHLAE
jgi:hypothetical protein